MNSTFRISKGHADRAPQREKKPEPMPLAPTPQ
jgi:hypothetical protein